MTQASVLYEKIGDHIALVTLNRPGVRNAISPEVTLLLSDILDRTENDPDIWVVILTGAGHVFCAGADLQAVSEGRGQELNTADGGFAGLVRAKRSKVWICAANGPAVAGGFEILLACDLAIASDTAKFALPEVRRGLVAAAGGLIHLPRMLPRALANDLIATGNFLSAQQALTHGIVSRLMPAETLRDGAIAFATEVAANAPLAVRESLALSRQAHDRDTASLFSMSADANDVALNSRDAVEGSRAFLEKRAPNWSGA